MHLEARPKLVSLSTAATSLSHSRIRPWEGREHPPSSSVRSILPSVKHHGSEVTASSEGRSDAELGAGAVLVAESKRGERGNASRSEQESRSPSSDSLGQPQPGSWGPASSSSPSSRDPVCTAGAEPGFTATACHTAGVPVTTPGSWLSSPQQSFRREVVGKPRQDDGCISPTSARDLLCDPDPGTYFICPTSSLPVKCN